MKLRAARAVEGRPADAPAASALYYFDHEVRAQAAKILPGEFLATARELVLVTLLGSCVAACLRDPVAGVGGINHFMLPESGAGIAGESARYGGYAMEMLINDLLKQGASRARLEAKVFGGGNVLKGLTVTNVGERNVAFVRQYLASERIPIVAQDVLDVCPRKIYYFPKNGRALVKRLDVAAVPGEVARLEALYQSRLGAQPVADGGVELFAP